MDAKRSGGLVGQAPGAPLTKTLSLRANMNRDIKTLLLNIIAGLVTFYVAKYFDENNLPILKYSVIILYVIFLIAVIFFHIRNTTKPITSSVTGDKTSQPNKNTKNDSSQLANEILINVVQLASQHAIASPKIIAPYVKESPELVLAYLKDMEKKQLVVYNSEGKEPTTNTSFFIAFNDNAWKCLKIEPR